MKGMKIMIAIAAVVMGLMTIHACKKDNASASGTAYNVRMTDDPGPYSQVNVDIQSVQVIGTDGSPVSLTTHSGVYNLLDFANGVDTLIASGNVSLSSVAQVKLILGTNNSIVLNGTTYAVAMPTGADAGLTLSIHQTVTAGTATNLLVDFDANQSIVADGSAQFHLRPVLRPINLDITATGIISGHITPVSSLAVITVTGSGGTYTTVRASDGYFKVRGLASGSYTVVVTPIAPLQPITINSVNVTAGNTTDIGLVAF